VALPEMVMANAQTFSISEEMKKLSGKMNEVMDLVSE
jgi:hypothetical protein